MIVDIIKICFLKILEQQKISCQIKTEHSQTKHYKSDLNEVLADVRNREWVQAMVANLGGKLIIKPWQNFLTVPTHAAAATQNSAE